MSFKIIRNDITKMNTEAIVNTANEEVTIGSGCDSAVYQAAGRDQLLKYRKENVGRVKEGEVFLTPGFCLQSKYIIHAVSPLFKDGKHGEEKKLRSCYSKSLQLAGEKGIRSIAFPLIAAGSFGYPKEEAMRIAADEINSFLLGNDMDIYLVVFGDKETGLGKKLYPGLEAYIDRNYVREASEREYDIRENSDVYLNSERLLRRNAVSHQNDDIGGGIFSSVLMPPCPPLHADSNGEYRTESAIDSGTDGETSVEKCMVAMPCLDFEEAHQSKLEERMKHMSDTYSQYLMYLIQERNMENAEVYKRAIVDKKIFSKIKNNKNYHPNKLTALCLCVGAMLNLDESRDLLARAGYALSPCDKTDIIFSYFIENEIYDMIELDIQLEEHGLPCIIS